MSGPVTLITGEGLVEVGLTVPERDVMWLNHPDQLTELGRVFRSALNRLVGFMPECQRIHFFYAGPTGGAVVLGQAINPRKTPPVEIYEFDRRQTPIYEYALTLK